jgi:uncharacterized protein (DUF1015 family)
MAEIRPFRGLRFSAEAGPFEKLIAPPYDVLTPAQRNAYAAQNPHNIVHLTLPEGNLDDRSKFVKYTRSAAALSEWRREGALVLETRPALYRYTQEFGDDRTGARLKRMSLIALIKVEPFSSGTVLPHEQTFPKHKEDRLRILEATRSHLESIFGLYDDPGSRIYEMVANATGGPSVHASVENILHSLDPIVDPEQVKAIQNEFSNRTIWIADGHHRYETALAFREALGARSEVVPEDYMVIALASMSDPGLVLLPTHRIVPSLKGRGEAEVIDPLRAIFNVSPCHSSNLYQRMEDAHREGYRAFGVALEGGNGYVVTPRDDASLIAGITGGGSLRLRSLDATVLHEVILGRLLRVPPNEPLEYSRDAAAAVRQSDETGAPSFLMLPPTVEDMKKIALAGERMPQKSTYYYPKIFSGLVLWSLSDF